MPLPKHVWELTVEIDNGDRHYRRTPPIPFDIAVRAALVYEETLEEKGGRLVSIVNVDHRSEPHTNPPAGAPHDNPRMADSGNYVGDILADAEKALANMRILARSIVGATVRHHDLFTAADAVLKRLEPYRRVEEPEAL